MSLHNLEAEKAVARFYKQQDRIIGHAGYGDTDVALRITKEHLGILSLAIAAKLQQPAPKTGPNLPFRFALLARQLEPELIAVLCLRSCLYSVGEQETVPAVLIQLGYSLEAECWARGLLRHNPVLANRIEKAARSRHQSVKDRRKAAKNIAAQHAYKQDNWSSELRTHAGLWLLECTLAALPHVFALEEIPYQSPTLILTPDAEATAEEMVSDMIQRRPVFLPMEEPPLPWTTFYKGGPRDQRETYARPLMRLKHKASVAECSSVIKHGQSADTLAAINNLQSTPWKINNNILCIIQDCISQGIDVPGLIGTPVPYPERPAFDMDDGQKRLWKLQCSRVRKHNLALVSDRLLLAEDMETAERMRDWPAFWTPMNLDWRGRVYSMTNFNFAREDRVRALFNFANGEPIGEDGIWWLKVHLANCGDFEKISKRPLEERVAWVDENMFMIEWCGQFPLHKAALSYWTKADKPFLFLAASVELVAALAHGPSYVTHLPVSFDGSCSGLQHLCAMTRAPEGSLVNLTPSSEPQDVYATVADRVRTRVIEDTTAPTEEGREWVPVVAKLALEYGIDRNLTKRNVMTYSYSSKKYGMAQQQQEDLMNPLDEEVLTGKREEHPFTFYAQDKGSASVAARYLAGHVYDSIEEIINLPAQAMTFLQKLAKALAHEGKPLRWTTPTGLPWINRYHEMQTKQIRLWLHDRCLFVKVAVGTTPEIDKEKAAAGVAPNFVHALDAAHLMLVANAAAKEGISIATVHDSFGCLAPRARRFNEIIREQFIAMYETHDVLAEVLAQAKHDLTPANWQRLPDAPKRGELKLEGVMDAKYAFA